MGRGKKLTTSEIKHILELKRQNLSVSKISKITSRSRKVVYNLLKDVENYGKKKSSGRPSSLSQRDKRTVLRIASNTQCTTKQIMQKVGVNASVSSVRCVLQSCKHIKRLKIKKKPALTPRHKQERLQFAKDRIHWKKKWRKVIFSDEKKFNLDGPDGLNYYFHDLRKEKLSKIRRAMGGGGVMVWAAIGYFGKMEIKFIHGKMNSKYYLDLIKQQITKYALCISGSGFIYQQDNAAVHTAKFVKTYFEKEKIPVLSWPARSPDINIIENCWSQLSQAVYKHGKQYENVHELKEAIVAEWSNLNQQNIRKLYKSLPNRMIEIIENKGGCTHY
ncbi:Transposable element Tc3 transposase [Anthophora plagiata]